ncbi:hypothetical protein HZF05_15330 [Sphingomonas sp. CGMCC 1.13654]|uniref:Uncharacterized protein n=1 Tax=Sphingomonas chungangi TaxID=2683589 RepID=A0A838LD87_9SPHN|nr:hypothetical protein [Sphingomonas chungangi]MBA2935458.1 hypothetical protein [Sphingomonas chungangi]MVW56965.1 hypothetical protein [Sphingomonas chungangi]
MSARFLLASLLLSTAASAAVAQTSEGKFRLECTSLSKPAPPMPKFVIDVNLDLMSYFSGVGGLDEVDHFDKSEIVFRRHGCDPHGLPCFTTERFDRQSGSLYFSDNRDGQPNATCSVEPAAADFRATSKYIERIN